MIFNVVLERRAQEGLGLAIKRGCPEEWATYGALVVDILPTGPAYGKLRPGDVIMSVNGVSLEGKSHPEMLDLLRRVEGIVNLLVYRREEMEVAEDGQRIPAGANSASCQSLFQPDGLSNNSQQGLLNESRRTYSMPGFASPQVTPSHAVSLPQLAVRSDDQTVPFSHDHRQASLLKVNLDKQNSREGLGVELSSQLVITSVAPGGKADNAGVRVGDRVVNLNGIDAAHLSLIDAAYLMRRDQSDVTLMRVEHDGEERNVSFLPETVQVPAFDNSPHYRHPCCRLQEPLHVTTSPMEYSPVLYKPIYPGHNVERSGMMAGVPHAHICNCNAMPRRHGYQLEAGPPERRNSQLFFNIENEDEPSDNGDGSSNGSEETRTRVVSIKRHPVIGTGLRITGGNSVGIFVSEVNPQSPAADAGVKTGDEIISINGEPVKSMTKAEAAAKILKSSRLIKLEVKQARAKFEAFMNDKLGPGDDFYVRAAFDYTPSIMNGSGGRSIDPSVSTSALSISRGDIFQVTDSLLAGSFTSWLARKVFPNLSAVGSIPSNDKADQLLKSQISSSRSTKESRPYMRVALLDSYPYPRPVIIYGPLADKAMSLLVEEVSTLEDLDEEPRFEVPPISGAPPQQDDIFTSSLSPPSAGVIRLSAIQMLMERGKHPVLNLRPSAIEGLLTNGITPIVLLVTATSIQQIRTALEHYRPRCPRGGPSIRDASRRLWAEIRDLRMTISHLITDSVPLFSSSDEHFDEIRWMQNLISIIRHHQSQPVWVAEDSVAYCKAMENIISPVTSSWEVPKLKIDESEPEKRDQDGREDSPIHSNGGYNAESSSFGKSSDEWGIPTRLELIEDSIEAGHSDSCTLKKRSDMRRVRIQSPRPDSKSVQTESPERKAEEISSTDVSPPVGQVEEKGREKRGVEKRHRPLSSDNVPCGLISEPQQVVAEANGEFLPADGGKLNLPDHGVELSIPPGAIPDDGDGTKQEIYLRVYEGEHHSEESKEEIALKRSHIVSPLVMCGPRGLRFQKPVTLTMPRFHTHYGGKIKLEVPKPTTSEARTRSSSSPPSSWSLRVMHAATQSDAPTTSASASASETEMRQHALRQWRTLRPPLSNIIDTSVNPPSQPAETSMPVGKLSGTESDSSGAITYQVAESFISLLIDHF
ncbi:hypothetical protein Aperf_G00000066518 [Anoplocephala perfoliata]